MTNSGELLGMPTSRLLDAFGAGGASPGSGSAASLLGLVSAQMSLTVCRISQRKAACASSHQELAEAEQLIRDHLAPGLEKLLEKDAADFDTAVELRRSRDKATNADVRSQLAVEALSQLEVATDNLFDVADSCSALVEVGLLVFEQGWPTVRGDSSVAVSAALAGVTSSLGIVALNLQSLEGREYEAVWSSRYDLALSRFRNLELTAGSQLATLLDRSER